MRILLRIKEPKPTTGSPRRIRTQMRLPIPATDTQAMRTDRNLRTTYLGDFINGLCRPRFLRWKMWSEFWEECPPLSRPLEGNQLIFLCYLINYLQLGEQASKEIMVEKEFSKWDKVNFSNTVPSRCWRDDFFTNLK